MVIRPKKDTHAAPAIKNPLELGAKEQKVPLSEKPTGYSVATAKDSEN